MKVSIKDLDKGAVLAALYNASRPQGMGFVQFDPKPMTAEQGGVLIKRQRDFDYLQGRVMKIEISGDEIDTWGYDRDNGEGAAAKAIASLRETGQPNGDAIKQQHSRGTLAAAAQLKDRIR